MKRTLDIINPDTAPTLPALFEERAARTPSGIGYRSCHHLSGVWQSITWREMAKEVSRWRAALMREGLKKGERVALMLSNCPEWICFDQAALSLGLVVVPLYINDRSENVEYILADTNARLFLCSGMAIRNHLAEVCARQKDLKRIVTIDFCQTHAGGVSDERIVCITDWLRDEATPAPTDGPTAEDTATIVYTSGTTGPPKGVMLSHRNIIDNAFNGTRCLDVYREDLLLSFLPLSHMLERTVGYYLPMMTGATVAFARSIPKLAEDILTVRPTLLICVPRIFERIHASIGNRLEKMSPPMKMLFEAAVTVGWRAFEHRLQRAAWSPSLLLHPLLDLLVGRKIRHGFGGRLRIVISGGAALPFAIARFFISLGLPIFQGYGLTETSPIISVNRAEDNDPTGVGHPLPGTEIRIGDFDELLVRSSSVMQGYWRRPNPRR